ncbi:TIR domain-containing protein [Clostridium nigeriense]|uniref:TIR domain-containing protein n=1 Tax=Clostridium nigeriense TaxID=1805470 RepID=UPI003D32F625
MSKRVYISADYSIDSGDRNVVDILNKWGSDNKHKVDFVDMSKVVSGSISKDPDCRTCDLKKEFNQQINASSAVIFVVGDKTASRKAGSACSRATKDYIYCSCTPYKQNTNGTKVCKVFNTFTPGENDDVGSINTYSYLKHEFEQAKKRKKPIIVVYNSLRKESSWLPAYMTDYKSDAQPFWIRNSLGEKVSNYAYIKEVLGYD